MTPFTRIAGEPNLDYQKISVYLIGNATHDGEVKTAKESGKQYGDFRLAVRDRNDQTTYFPVRCFGKLAESVVNVRCGAKLFVDGDLEISAYADDEGAKRMGIKVVANTYRILSGGRSEPEKEAGSEETAQTER